MTRKELETKLWEINVDWYHHIHDLHENLYTADGIIVIINDEAFEIELESAIWDNDTDENGIWHIPTMETPYTITEVNWVNYADNIWHYFVKFDDFCKEFNIE